MSTSTPLPFPKPGIAWGTVIVLVTLSTISYVDRQIVSLMIDPIRHYFHASDFKVSLLQGVAFALFYVVAAIPIGVAVDRHSRRRIIHLGVSIWSLAAASCGLAGSYGQLLVSRALVGAGEGSLAPAAYSMIADLFPKRRLAFAMGVFAMGSAIGSGAALAVGGAVVAWATKLGGVTLPLAGHLEPWQFAFIVTGLPGIVVALLIFAVPEPARRGTTEKLEKFSIAPLIAFIRSRPLYFLCHFGGFGLLSMSIYGSSSWAPAYLMRNFGWSPAQVGVYYGLTNFIAGTSGFVGGGWIVDRWFHSGRTDAHFRFFLFSVPVSSLIMAIAFMASSPTLFLILFTIAAAIISFTGVAAASLQIVTPNQLRGQVSSLFIFSFNLIGVGFGSTLVAAFTDGVFGGSAHVGEGVIASIALLAPIIVVLMWLGQRASRDAVLKAAAWDIEATQPTT